MTTINDTHEISINNYQKIERNKNMFKYKLV